MSHHFHFAPAEGWLNDPNGLVYENGQWHLYFQYVPQREGGPKHWGHATSPDLFHWTEHSVAIYPDELGEMYSGSAVNSGDGEITAIYTNHRHSHEVQSIAVSRDHGMTFTPYEGNPVLDRNRPDFRDPKVFRFGDEWRMIVSAFTQAEIYSSPDLRDWSLLSDFYSGVPAWGWECPDLFPVSGPDGLGKWCLIGSFIVPGSYNETHYWLGEFDGTAFSAETGPHPLAFGPDDYAAVSWADAPGNRRVLIGWMNRWAYAGATPADCPVGPMTVPRELTLLQTDHGVRLVQRPVPELESLRQPMTRERRAEIWADLAPGQTLNLIFSGAERVAIRRLDTGEIEMDRTFSGRVDFHPGFSGTWKSAPLTSSVVQILVDTFSVEIFGDDGLAYGGMLIFPTGKGLTVQAPDGVVRDVFGIIVQSV